MNYLFSGGGFERLRTFAAAGTLIALDYDGTLAPICDDPGQAQMSGYTRQLLTCVARKFPTCVVTGRARQDAMDLIGLGATLDVIGNHGMESESVTGASYVDCVSQWRESLESSLRGCDGIVIEDKKFTLSIHFRSSLNRQAAEAAILKAASTLEGARIVGGKCVVNVVPEGATDKGAALLDACARVNCRRAIFVGDDVTDEAVFALGLRERILSIRVGFDPSSQAEFYVKDRDQVDWILHAVATA
ncbi:MAG: trehalose-phosphatase [Tahibacter sp.]